MAAAARTVLTLRATLREATGAAHDRLDRAMRRTGWSDRASYGEFLRIQHDARAPLETWFAGRQAGDAVPPAQCGLLQDDLHALALEGVRKEGRDFHMPEGGDPVGIAWVLAGSSLGNLAILREIERAGNGDWPTSFLCDPAMRAFWKILRERLDAPLDNATDPHAAVLAATSAFDHFAACVDDRAREAA